MDQEHLGNYHDWYEPGKMERQTRLLHAWSDWRPTWDGRWVALNSRWTPVWEGRMAALNSWPRAMRFSDYGSGQRRVWRYLCREEESEADRDMSRRRVPLYGAKTSRRRLGDRKPRGRRDRSAFAKSSEVWQKCQVSSLIYQLFQNGKLKYKTIGYLNLSFLAN